MDSEILKILRDYYSEIYKKIGNKGVIRILNKDGNELYIVKIHNAISFISKGCICKKGIDKSVFSDLEVLIAVGHLNEHISDISKKQDFFEKVMELMKFDNNIINIKQKSA